MKLLVGFKYLQLWVYVNMYVCVHVCLCVRGEWGG